jgi:hypothetical protein
MPVKKTYIKAEVKSAIDLSNQNYFAQFLRVRNDITNAQFNSTAASGSGPYAYPGRGSDVGHVFRHVDGSAAGGKSTFEDEDTMHRAVMALLNSPGGQARLEALDQANPAGDETGYNGRSAMTETLSGSVQSLNLYGNTQAGVKKKIKRAMCIVQKLGASTLWVHTAYPTSFVN